MIPLSDGQLGHLRRLVDLPDLSGTRYLCRHRLATGGMGSVYLVHDRELDRLIALKVLTLPDEAGALTRRMRREARIVARLEHPGIVPIHDVGTLADGRIYYTMKYVQGETLESNRARLPGRGNLLRSFQRVCEAVQFAHVRGVIHRDLKPANVMVGPFGEVLVMDWGLAASLATGATDDEITPTPPAIERSPAPSVQTTDATTAHGAVFGTPGYMSPEQATGDLARIGPATDVYGLGGILYFILTGRAPTGAGTPAEAVAQAVSGEFPPPRALDRTIPRPLEAICLKAMARDLAGRYPSAAAVAADVGCFLDHESVSAYRETVFEKTWRWVGRNRFIVFIVLAYVVVRFLLLLFRGI